MDEESRIYGRTEAMEYISQLVDEYRRIGMEGAAEMLEEKIEEYANS